MHKVSGWDQARYSLQNRVVWEEKGCVFIRFRNQMTLHMSFSKDDVEGE